MVHGGRMRGNTRKLKQELFQLGLRKNREVKLPREVVLTPSFGFSRPDGIKALSNVV